jgi:DNA-binding NarL/FixJ family response regulator
MKILVVDDEQLVQWFLDRTLRKNGHEVMTAGNALDAEAKLGSEHVDVLLTDLRMPGENGTALIGKVDKRGKKSKVIVCSAFVTAELEDELRQKNICVLRKPIGLDELNEAVRICIEKGTPRSTAAVLIVSSEIPEASSEERGETLERRERETVRDEILADFQFYIGNKPEEVFEGMTVNISLNGLCFLARTSVKEGQIITITKMAKKSAMPDFTGRQAKVIWVKKGVHYDEAGVDFHSDERNDYSSATEGARD